MFTLLVDTVSENHSTCGTASLFPKFSFLQKIEKLSNYNKRKLIFNVIYNQFNIGIQMEILYKLSLQIFYTHYRICLSCPLYFICSLFLFIFVFN